MSPSPLHVVVAGGGIAALETVLALHDLAPEAVRVTLVAPEREFELKPLRTAEPFAVDHVRRYPLAGIARDFGAELQADAIERVDPARHVVVVAGGEELGYDALVVAVGGRFRPAYDRVITFGADARTDTLNGLLADLDEHYSRSVAFVVPPGVTWPLPLYEIALMTAAEVWGMGVGDVQLELITPESAPLAIFGPQASDAVAGLLADARIAFRPSSYAEVGDGGRIHLTPGGAELRPERIVALPLLDGPRIRGLPADAGGFLPIDDHGRVRGVDDVYAAGDGADFPIKQGGLACQQADAVAEHLARRAGVPGGEPKPFHPVLRGKLLTGRGAQFLRHAVHGGAGESRASDFHLWFPPTKVSGRYLSEWLVHLDGPDAERTQPLRPPRAEEPQVDVNVPLPSPYELGRSGMELDPYSPLPHWQSR